MFCSTECKEKAVEIYPRGCLSDGNQRSFYEALDMAKQSFKNLDTWVNENKTVFDIDWSNLTEEAYRYFSLNALSGLVVDPSLLSEEITFVPVLRERDDKTKREDHKRIALKFMRRFKRIAT